MKPTYVVFTYPILIYMAFKVTDTITPQKRESTLKINKSAADSLESFP